MGPWNLITFSYSFRSLPSRGVFILCVVGFSSIILSFIFLKNETKHLLYRFIGWRCVVVEFQGFLHREGNSDQILLLVHSCQYCNNKNSMSEVTKKKLGNDSHLCYRNVCLVYCGWWSTRLINFNYSTSAINYVFLKETDGHLQRICSLYVSGVLQWLACTSSQQGCEGEKSDPLWRTGGWMMTASRLRPSFFSCTPSHRPLTPSIDCVLIGWDLWRMTYVSGRLL